YASRSIQSAPDHMEVRLGQESPSAIPALTLRRLLWGTEYRLTTSSNSWPLRSGQWTRVKSAHMSKAASGSLCKNLHSSTSEGLLTRIICCPSVATASVIASGKCCLILSTSGSPVISTVTLGPFLAGGAGLAPAAWAGGAALGGVGLATGGASLSAGGAGAPSAPASADADGASDAAVLDWSPRGGSGASSFPSVSAPFATVFSVSFSSSGIVSIRSPAGAVLRHVCTI